MPHLRAASPDPLPRVLLADWLGAPHAMKARGARRQGGAGREGRRAQLSGSVAAVAAAAPAASPQAAAGERCRSQGGAAFDRQGAALGSRRQRCCLGRRRRRCGLLCQSLPASTPWSLPRARAWAESRSGPLNSPLLVPPYVATWRGRQVRRPRTRKRHHMRTRAGGARQAPASTWAALSKSGSGRACSC